MTSPFDAREIVVRLAYDVGIPMLIPRDRDEVACEPPIQGVVRRTHRRPYRFPVNTIESDGPNAPHAGCEPQIFVDQSTPVLLLAG